MKNRHLALASALAVLSAVALSPKAQAQNSTTVNFNGTVSSTCTFSNVQNGTLVQPSPTAEYLMAESFLNNTGTSGSLEVNCTASSSLSISAPVKIQAPAGFNPDIVQAVLLHPILIATTNGNGQFSNSFPWNFPTSPIPSLNNSPYEVSMVVGKNANTNGLPSGTYEYQVTVTATPN
ncbi:hypothetical protein PMG71_16830 [Roseofilum sp. BLCC_M154]|uniref:Spore coat protein U domain-containing protein n=1 Tax=Roseofilum acuticapitatum BLCC-M154 TaxID=3022444 RepID=A0ABT7AXT8_9CYAN|nr:hypothetical protein [Roseofilum acuticapitatum]MDJ1171096.1 hypothetical protein [Roseofilum acuticapitatum BLCC-M154]